MFVVTVAFEVAPPHLSGFRDLVAGQAQASLEREPACRRFDVCEDTGDPLRIFLYELYDDAVAFDAHLGTDHFKRFDAAAAPMVLSKTVRTYTRIAP